MDFSEPSRGALRHAAAVAVRSKGVLTVMYANDPLLTTAAAVALHDRTLASRSASELRRFVDATLDRRLRSRLRLKTRVVVGSAADGILDAVAASRSDLIVMGTHGLTGADRLFMGSTTLGVLRRTKVPVLAVPRAASRRRPTRSAWPHGPVVAAVELDRGTHDDVETGVRVARWLGRRLLLLHVVERTAAPTWLQRAQTVHDRARRAQAQRALEALARMAGRHVEADIRLVSGRPALKIASAVSAAKSELLITYLRDRRGWFGARRGSISYHVLSHAVVPVLACPRQWRPR